MKKIFFICFPLIFILASCADPVFSNIRKEVSLVSATVKGPVNSIVRFKSGDDEYLLTQNGNGVYFKETGVERTGESSVWTKRDSRFGTDVSGGEIVGEQIVGLAADSANIYVLAQSMKRNTSDGVFEVSNRSLYYTNELTGSSWTKIEVTGGISLTDCRLFCNNAADSENRNAYFRNGDSVYKLGEETFPDSAESIETKDDATKVNSAVYFKSSDIFFGSLASVTNGTYYYYGSADKICYSNDSDPDSDSGSVSANGYVSCIAVTSDSLLYGTGNSGSTSSGDGGIYKYTLVENKPKSSAGFSNNAQAVFTSSYQLLTLLVEDPAKKESESNIFASIDFKTSGSSISVSYNNICLWAYYPTRGNWNRE